MSTFLNMGGYAVFVWSSFGVSAMVLILNVIIPILRRKQLLKEISGKQKRMQSRTSPDKTSQ